MRSKMEAYVDNKKREDCMVGRPGSESIVELGGEGMEVGIESPRHSASRFRIYVTPWPKGLPNNTLRNV